MKKVFSLLLILCTVALPVIAKSETPDKTKKKKEITIKLDRYTPGMRNVESVIAYRMMEKYPYLQILPFSQLRVEGGLGGISAKLMAIAGRTAPDLMFVMIHEMRLNISQGFYMPLNKWIGEDKNGDGKIEGDEVKWEPWKKMDPYYKYVATVNGKIYGVPFSEALLGLMVRADIWRQYGIDPGKFPKDWNEIFKIFQELTFPKKKIEGAQLDMGQYALGISPTAWTHLVWYWSANASFAQVGKRNPKTGKIHWFDYEETDFIDPETGDVLAAEKSIWRSSFANDRCLEVLDFIHKLRWQPWIRVEKNHPLNLTEKDIEKGYVKDPETGKTYNFTNDDVIYGVCRVFSQGDPVGTADAFANGEITALFSGIGSRYSSQLADLNLDPAKIGFMPFPPMNEKCNMAIFRSKYFYTMNFEMADASAEKQKLAWEIITRLCTEEGKQAEVEEKVLQGYASFVSPHDLKEAGFKDYISEVPEHWKKLFNMRKKVWHTECYAPGSVQIQNQFIGARLIGLMYTNKDFDYKTAAQQLQDEANIRIFKYNLNELGKTPVSKENRRWDDYLLVALVVFAFGFLFIFGAKKMAASKLEKQKIKGSTKDVSSRFTPFLLLAPALISVLLWAYYPLLRGTIITFQDYKITGNATFVGLDNFIEIFRSGKLFKYLLITFKFVAITLGVGFFAPIILAILLNEIPKCKTFFRTMYYLPRISSPLVIMFIWKLMFNPTEFGTLNKLLGVFGIPAQTWLQDPSLAMFCCIIPTIWGTAGAGSLIYLAALKGVPEDCYEAADIDGAGFFNKLFKITIPTIKPLIIINFVGASIAAFQGMGNIFVMTGGGPGEATTVLSLAIWKEAFVYLKFGIASSMGWILGAMLIAFSLWQLRILNKVEFRRAAEN